MHWTCDNSRLLLPCPRCGKAEHLSVVISGYGTMRVQCAFCGFCGPSSSQSSVNALWNMLPHSNYSDTNTIQRNLQYKWSKKYDRVD